MNTNEPRPSGLPPCVMSKNTLLVILGPLAASTDGVAKNARAETSATENESLANIEV